MMSILIFALGAALLSYCAEKLISHLVGAAAGLHVSVFLLAIVFTGIEFDDVALGMALNLEDLGQVALGTVFGTAISMTGIVLALAALVTPTRIDVPRSYIALFAVSPLVLIPFLATPPLTVSDGVILMLLFVAFIGYVAHRELRSTTPVFRNAEILEKVGSGGCGPAVDVPPPFPVATPHLGARPMPWAVVGMALLTLLGLIGAAALTSAGIDGILDDFAIPGTVFGATVATLVLALEDILLTVEPGRRGAPEIGIGNVIGSVVFGVTAKLGIILLTGGRIEIDEHVLDWHLPVLIGMTGLSAYIISTGRLRRRHGVLLLALFVAYWVVTFAVMGGLTVDD